jgi:hypothetical protein
MYRILSLFSNLLAMKCIRTAMTQCAHFLWSVVLHKGFPVAESGGKVSKKEKMCELGFMV